MNEPITKPETLIARCGVKTNPGTLGDAILYNVWLYLIFGPTYKTLGYGSLRMSYTEKFFEWK